MCSVLDRFDMQLAQALGESVFERSLREKMSQESNSVQWELGRVQEQLEVRGVGDPGAIWALGCWVSCRWCSW